MIPRFTLRKMFVVITLATVLFWFLMPITAINRRVVERIKPGMSIGQAVEVVGLRLGVYDGICSWQTNAPDWGKGSIPSWIGINGEIVLIIDRDEVVTRAEFHRSRIGDWSVTSYLSERITWLQEIRAPLTERIGWYLGLAAVGAVVIGELCMSAAVRNREAWLGLAGLFVIGPLLSVAIFGDGAFDPALFMLAPFTSAFIGIAVGFVQTRAAPVTPELQKDPDVRQLDQAIPRVVQIVE